jgi:two-component system sensor histidine kinase KdpD
LSYVIAGSAVALMTAFMVYVRADASIANIPMLYMLVVLATALLFGSLPAIFGSILCFLCFDWFFIEPRYQFTVQDPIEWISLCTFLFTATVTGQLTAMLHARAEENTRHNQETEALAAASWTVASELDPTNCLNKVLAQIASVVALDAAAIFVPCKDGETELQAMANYRLSVAEEKAAQKVLHFVMDRRQPVNWDGNPLWDKALADMAMPGLICLPIIMEGQVLGVLYLKLDEPRTASASAGRVITSLANHAAVVLQRHRLMRAEASAQALIEADRLKTALLSMVSHDFRSPLTSIKASVGGLLQQGTPCDAETQLSLLQAIDAETDRLNRMVGNILDLSRLEAGAWTPRRDYTSITELVGAALDSFDDKDNRRINVLLAADLPEVYVDSVQIVQVLRNLLENALKYSPPDKSVEMEARCADKEVAIEVRDHGSGLPKGFEQRIFEPFFRAPEMQESSVPGVGIGLAVCQGLVAAHKGDLTASNREGGGATFRVTLPTEAQHAEQQTEAQLT